MPPEKQRTVLVIDDSADDRATYCRYLQRSSSPVDYILEADSGATALDICQRSRPDVILLDYLLPDMDGLEFLALMQQSGNQHIPILMLTGQGSETIAAQAIKSGAQDYLVKGTLTADGLCKALDYAIERFQLQQRLKQQEQEQQQQILSAIALRIRQSLTLQTILDTSVAEVRQYLAADRVVIYQFAPNMSGRIVAEAVLPEWLVSLHSQIEDACLRENLGDDYWLGRTRAIANIYDAGLSDCHIQLLERFQVKANLVVPLLITDQNGGTALSHHAAALPQLWGWLVVHQCSTTRQWQPSETDLLSQVAVQMAIAIQHAELYQQLQNELTERKRMELMLRTSEKRLRLALDFTQIGSWDWNILTNQMTWNGNYIRLLGLKPQDAEASYESWRDRIHSDDIDHVESAIQQSLVTRTCYVAEYRVCHPDGSLHWILSKGQALYDESGQPIHMLGVILDITDRKHAEMTMQQLNQVLETRVQERTAKLRVSEARLREAQRIAHVGNWELDLTTQKITWSEELFRLFGLDASQGEPEYTEHLQNFSPESRHRLERAVEQATALGRPYELELQILHADGSVGWLFACGKAVRNTEGAIVKLLGTALDITDRKRSEEALRESERRYATLAAAAPVAIFRFDAVANCVYVNDRWSAMTGRPAVEALGNGWVEAIHPHDRDPIAADVAQWLQTCKAGDLYRTEARILRPDGSILWYFCQMLPETDSSGVITGYVGTLTDITDRKQAEEQLQNLSDRLTLAVKSGAIGIWEWSIKNNRMTCDEQMYKLYGITPDPLTSFYEGWISRLHPDDRPLTEAALQQTMAGEKDYDLEFRVIHPDGTIRFIKAYALVRRNSQGEPQQMVGINYDITDRKQSEQALQQLTIDLQRSNQELEQFAYVASHDLQEPLRAITSYTQLLAKRYQGQIDEKADKYIYYVVDGAARMQQLIQDLLAYSRVGRYELKQQPTDCNALFQQVRQDLRMAIAESNAVITVDPLPTILADTAQVTQVFQNLIGNALKYRGQEPPILRISARQQGREWVFSIQDNGIGIEPQYTERIFEIFQRLHTHREYEGTGLGLAICKKIVERHHGHIWVESQLGQGATFFFTLPALPNNRH